MTAETDRTVDEIRFEVALGHVLRSGTILAGSIVLTGAVIYLARHGSETPHLQVFHGEPSDLTSIRGVLADVQHGSGRAVIQLGVLTLMATPVFRVLSSVFVFARERDWTYVGITLIVLSLLAYSLLAT